MSAVVGIRFDRSKLPADVSLCDHCVAKCCRYIALPIDTPKTAKEWDYLRWFMIHERIALFTEEKKWYLQVFGDCRHLLPDSRCGIYSTRPQICRDYTTDECEFDDSWTYERFFETAEQLEEYLEATTPKPAGASLRGPRPEILPIVG